MSAIVFAAAWVLGGTLYGVAFYRAALCWCDWCDRREQRRRIDERIARRRDQQHAQLILSLSDDERADLARVSR